jgi:mannose-6-phosphate isomerase
MGTHPSNPSRDVESGRTLLELMAENKFLLSTPVAERFSNQLPFLFKVLSINKALSIQAHPNKTLAAQLHARDPAHYPDDNHKPEMAIAITPFEGLCGFRPLREIAHFLEHVAPLRALVGEAQAKAFVDGVAALSPPTPPKDGREGEAVTPEKKALLKAAFSALMVAPTEAVAEQIPKLAEQARSEGAEFAGRGVSSTPGKTLSELVTRLHAAYGTDIGLFVLFFLNFVQLSPGEALFLVADDIHAYLSGDIMECMAASDNVVRAGLTPKFKDVPTLVDMLTYNFAPIADQKMAPTEYAYATLNRGAYSAGSGIVLYDPPIDEFAVVRTVLRGGDLAKATFDPLEGPSVVICTSGRGRITVGTLSEPVEEGYVFFVGSRAGIVLEGVGGDDEREFVTFKAFCEVE